MIEGDAQRLVGEQAAQACQLRPAPVERREMRTGAQRPDRRHVFQVTGVVDQTPQINVICLMQIPQDLERSNFSPLIGGYGMRWVRNSRFGIVDPESRGRISENRGGLEASYARDAYRAAIQSRRTRSPSASGVGGGKPSAAVAAVASPRECMMSPMRGGAFLMLAVTSQRVAI